jgi:hypothetical protein
MLWACFAGLVSQNIFLTVDETQFANAGLLHAHQLHWTHHFLERAATPLHGVLHVHEGVRVRSTQNINAASYVADSCTNSNGGTALSHCIPDDVREDDGCVVLRLHSLSGREYTLTSMRRCRFGLINKTVSAITTSGDGSTNILQPRRPRAP